MDNSNYQMLALLAGVVVAYPLSSILYYAIEKCEIRNLIKKSNQLNQRTSSASQVEQLVN